MKKVIKLPFIFALAMALWLGSCKQNNTSMNTEIVSDTLMWTLSEIDLNYVLLPPADLMLFISDLDLKPHLSNPASNIDKYNSLRSKSVNLGVYMADMIYMAVRDDKIQLPKYYQNVKGLSDELRVFDVFTEDLMERFNRNLNRPDSLFVLSSELQSRFVGSLDESGRQNILALVSLGVFIESLYLTLLNLEDHNDFNEVNSEILNQKVIFEQYYQYAEYYIKDPNVQETMRELDELNEFFQKLNIKNVEHSVIKDSANHLTITGGEEINLSEREFKELTGICVEVRGKLIEK